jgi:hypothetical protein
MFRFPLPLIAGAVIGFVAPAFGAPGAAGAQAAPGAALAPPAPPAAPAPPGPVRFTAHYVLGISIDPARNAEVSTALKAAKGAMSLVGGLVSAGTVDDTVSLTGDRYSIVSRTKANRLVAAVLKGDTLTRQSEGAVDNAGYIASEKFTETRGAKHRYAVTTDYDKRTSNYAFNGKPTTKEAVQYRIADTASMPYLFLRQPLPSGSFTVAATDGRKLRQFALNAAEDVVAIGNKNVMALRLTRTRLEGNDAALDIWLRKEDGMPLRIRVGLDKKYGIVLDQKLAELPPIVK